MQLQIIQQKIFEIRGHKVMLDFDLAEMYEVETRVFNQAIKRNIDSFPEDFMFRLTAKEWKQLSSELSSKSVNKDDKSLISQFVISNRGGRQQAPYAFTEHGVTMLASVLKSPTARKMNIAIVRAFIELRKFAVQYTNIIGQLQELKERVGNHDAQLNQIYEALDKLLAQKEVEEDWENRQRIGFKATD
ncbi:ORF6N domain-containing protein [Parasediminibacterium sp. JCM 36343]|uniref:ORF6N domain-containing protein n=1 Tax=Parasediminibacterium sp. JCM 36343 TaxID=3374279 RepID=UPI00397868F6